MVSSNMISSNLATLGSNLRQAATRRAYADVERLAVKVGAAAAAEASALPAGDPGVGKIAAWLKDLFARTEILLRIARASQAHELRHLTFLKRYLPPPDRRAEHVRLAL
jgi:hypothetical protein